VVELVRWRAQRGVHMVAWDDHRLREQPKSVRRRIQVMLFLETEASDTKLRQAIHSKQHCTKEEATRYLALLKKTLVKSHPSTAVDEKSLFTCSSCST
jgi:hypothetical protein